LLNFQKIKQFKIPHRKVVKGKGGGAIMLFFEEQNIFCSYKKIKVSPKTQKGAIKVASDILKRA
jgi:hypothetical protein